MCKKYYCGFQFLPRSCRKQLSSTFNHCCKQHDIDYTNQLPRLAADRIFLKNMLKQATSPKTRALAYFFYISVRLFGWISYPKNK